jgi:hypothetical protein
MEFPIEVWQLVLNHFDRESLKKCLEWSDTFRDLIITCPTLMRKLPVVLEEHSWRERLSFVEAHGGFVKAVKCQNLKVDDVKRILELTPNVEEIICENAIEEDDESEAENIQNINVETKKDCDGLNLPKLTKLNITSTSHYSGKLLKLLTTSKNLQSFSKTISTDLYSPSIGSHLADFISKQKHLEQLELNGNIASTRLIDAIFTEKFVRNFGGKLKSFRILSMSHCNSFFYQFLMNQSNSIQELTLSGSPLKFNNFYLILSHFHNLTKLNIELSVLLNDENAAKIEAIRVSKLRELTLLNHHESIAVFYILIDIFPNIEALTMEVSEFPMSRIFTKLQRLRKLHATRFYIEMLLFSRSESLVELIMTDVNPINDDFQMEELARNFPNLERMVIRNYDTVRLNQTIERDVEIRIKSLKLFKRLKFFEFSHTPSSMLVSNDAKSLENPREENIRSFCLKIATIRGVKSVEASEYFAEKHKSAIEYLKRD